MRVIVGDPGTRALVEADLPDSEMEFMEACRVIVGASCLEMSTLASVRGTMPVAVWLDEDGLSDPLASRWSILGADAPMAGRFVLAGRNDDGGPIALRASMAEIASLIEWWVPARSPAISHRETGRSRLPCTEMVDLGRS